MKYGYARVSTLVQLKGNSLEDQCQKLIEAGVPEENIVVEQYSGKTIQRRKFQKLISQLKEGDELFCTKLDRFARNSEEGQRLIRELTERNIAVYILNIGGNRHPLTTQLSENFNIMCFLQSQNLNDLKLLNERQREKRLLEQKPAFGKVGRRYPRCKSNML